MDAWFFFTITCISFIHVVCSNKSQINKHVLLESVEMKSILLLYQMNKIDINFEIGGIYWLNMKRQMAVNRLLQKEEACLLLIYI